tara:strand:- start:14903 stop:15433 length:531 start_codon:yes stop_codon:yes gene_type:complete
MINFTFNMNKAVVDQKALTASVDRGVNKAMPKSLDSMKRRIQASYTTRSRSSRAGESPSVHSFGRMSLRNVQVEYDSRKKTGFVGPALLSGQRSLVETDQPLPGLLEAGGWITVPEVSWDGERWFTETRRRRAKPGQKKRKRRVRMAARPAIGPAFNAEAQSGNTLSPWQNVVTNG